MAIPRRRWWRGSPGWSLGPTDDLRLFLAAYLPILGASLIILPRGLLTPTRESDVAAGCLAAASGLALLWLAPLRRDRWNLFAHLVIASLQSWLAATRWSEGAIAAASLHVCLGAAVVICGLPRVDPPSREPPRRHASMLVVIVAAANAALGVTMMVGLDSSAQIAEAAGISSTAWGAALVVSSLLALALGLAGSPLTGLRWLPGAASGVLLIGLIVAASTRVEAAYLLLGATVYVRASATLVPGLWASWGRAIHWNSIGARFGIALVTAALVPMFVLAFAILHGPGAGAAVDLTSRQLAFGVLSASAVVALVGGMVIGARVAIGAKQLASRIERAGAGDRASLVESRDVEEAQLIGRAVEDMTRALDDHRAARERSLELMLRVERALSSPLEMKAAATRLVETLVPSFSDAAAVYVPRGDAVACVASTAPRAMVTATLDQASQPTARGPALVIASGLPELHLDGLPDDYFGASPTASPTDVRSHMTLPIIDRDRRILGAVTASLLSSGRQFTPDDVATLGDITTRTALCIEYDDLYAALQRSNLQLRTANAAKDEFLGLVSHELKTPITAILGNAILLRRHPDRADGASFLDDLVAESERLAAIVDNLLALVRLDAETKVEDEPILLARVIEREITRQAASPRREIRSEGAEGIVVYGSSDRLEMVVRNLLHNALKYGEADSPVDVRARADGGRATVAVLDRGPGIEAGELSRLFTAFYRSPRDSERAPGLGIGLAVCRRIVEAAGGTIWAENRTDVRGSLFAFTWPLAPDDGDEVVDAPEAADEVRVEPLSPTR